MAADVATTLKGTVTDRQAARPLVWSTAVYAVGALLHADRVPFWAMLAVMACVAWRLGGVLRPFGLPGRYLRTGLMLALAVAVFFQFQTLNGLAAGTALLVVMGAIKLLETRGRRDYYIVIGAGLFLLLAACLDRQGLLRTPLYVAHAWLACTALAVVADTGGRLNSRAAVTLAGKSLLLALPLALMLFVFFPRLPGGFWALPRQDQAMTGLGEEMSPGSITQLTETGEPAFRVWFEDEPPPPQERYWRGPVLHEFDGYTWRRPRNWLYRLQPLEALGRPYRYRIAMEPHFKNWWFALDTVAASPHPRVQLTYDYQLVSSRPVTELTSYEAVSYTRTRATQPLSLLARRYETTLPDDRNLRSLELARSLRARTADDAQYVEAVLEFLRTGGFEYTLTPPRLDYNSVDDFLFNTRRGFCGHFASAFVTLMRAADVPSRVVTGYLGGEWNPVGRYFLVTQADAHAWAEVWLDGRGWVRVDPTGVVAPERLQRGIVDIIPGVASAQTRMARNRPWLARTVQTWDAINAWWNDRIVKFDFRAQLRLLDRLGFDKPGWQHLGWVLAIGLAAWLAWIAWHTHRASHVAPPDALARAYARLCAKLERAGLPRAAHEGPLTYAESVARRRPDLVKIVQPMLARYAELRYGPAVDESSRSRAVATFTRAVARLHLGR